MNKISFCLSIATLVLGTAARSEPLKKVPESLNPNKAYLLVEYRLQKNPYGGFPGSRKTLPLTAGLAFGRYDPKLGDIRGMGKASGNPVAAKQRATEPFRNRPIAKGPDSRLFLIEVDPDTWVVQGWGNTSFSLGSYALELSPGTVTDLGVVTAEPDWAEGDRPPDAGDVIAAAFLGPFAKRPDIAPTRVSFRLRGPADLPIPVGIPSAQLRQVVFTPDAKFGNYLGGLVNRIDGVNARLRQSGAVPAPPAPEASSARE